jgi:hypothetical protein
MAVLVAVPLLAAAEAATVVLLPRHHAAAPPRPNVQATPAPTTTTTPRVAAAVVSGTVTGAHLVGAIGAPLPMPITVTVPNRGQGALNIDGVVVMSHPDAQVAWDGGQPLPITGSGLLVLGAATMDAGPAGITWHLDGTPRYLLPGSYTAESSVAVGTAGLALAVDQVGFTVTAGSRGRLETDGDAQVHLSRRSVTVTGPGLVQLLGRLSVTTTSGTRAVINVHAGSGAFSLSFTPITGGFAVYGTLAGPLTFP